MREWGRFVLGCVDLQAREMSVLDEEQDAVAASSRIGGDQHAILYRGVERARSCSWAKIHRRASASAVSGDDCRRDLSPKLLRAGEVLRKERQNDDLLVGG